MHLDPFRPKQLLAPTHAFSVCRELGALPGQGFCQHRAPESGTPGAEPRHQQSVDIFFGKNCLGHDPINSYLLVLAAS